MHYFKRNIGDYHKKAGRLNMLQHGAYTLLMDACYDRERFPTREEAIDWCWASSEAEIAAVDLILSKFFELHEGVYKQDRIAEEVEQYHANAATNARIAQEREAKKKEQKARSVNDASTVSHEPPPNHKPLTINQEPIDKTLTSSGDDNTVKIDYQAIVDLFNKTLPELPAVKILTDKRKSAIRSCALVKPRFSEIGFWEVYFQEVRKSDFLMGRKTDWKADFDFLTTRSKFVKVVEGAY